MKIQIKNESHKPNQMMALQEYFESVTNGKNWEYLGLVVELDPVLDFKGDDALIRWTDIHEGFNDKLIVNSIEEFQEHFHLINA
jgi:hypothetical protein